MKANELMIGNFLEFECELCQVKEIDNQGVRVYFVETKEDIWIDLFQFSNISITEEWLLKSGFIFDESTGNYWYNLQDHYIELIKIKDKYYPVIAQVNEFANDEEQRVYLNHIDFVHQLQNLFFAFTGKELTIKI